VALPVHLFGGAGGHPSGDNKHGVWGKVATPKKKGVVPYVGATFRLVVKGTPLSGEVRIHEWTSTTVTSRGVLLDKRWEKYSVSVLFYPGIFERRPG